MTGTDMPDELGYHLRELRADLRLAQTALRAAASAADDPAFLRAWIEAESLLDHDLQVHLPRAHALLPEQPAPADRPADDAPHGQDDLVAIAGVAGRLVDQALRELAGAATPSATGLAAAGRAMAAAHRQVQHALGLVIARDP